MPKETFLNLSEEKKERIITAAALLFGGQGFERTDMAELAGRAGVAKGSIYNYFENKDDFFLFICREGLERSRRQIYGGIQPEWDVFRQIEHIFRKGADFARRHPEYLRLYLSIFSSGMERFAEELSPEVEKYFANYFKKMLVDYRQRGLIGPDVDVNLAAFLINSLYTMLILSLVSGPYRIRLREYFDLQGESGREDGEFETALKRILEMIRNFLVADRSRG